MPDYRINVHTGNVDGAGTDSNVYLTLFGTNGSSDEMQLDSGRDRIVTEAITNAVRHAAARHIWVTVLAVGKSLQVTVVDDGRGSDGVETGSGLASMRRRAETLGGTFRITSKAYEGTTVAATVPLDAR